MNIYRFKNWLVQYKNWLAQFKQDLALMEYYRSANEELIADDRKLRERIKELEADKKELLDAWVRGK